MGGFITPTVLEQCFGASPIQEVIVNFLARDGLVSIGARRVYPMDVCCLRGNIVAFMKITPMLTYMIQKQKKSCSSEESVVSCVM